MGSLQLCTSVGSVLYQTCLSFLLPPAWPWPPPPLLTQATWSGPLPCSMPTLTGQECPPLTLPPPVLAAVLPSITASVALMLRRRLSQDTWLMDMDSMEFLLVFLTMELFTESTSFTQLDTPSNMLPVASVVRMLMPMLMLTMVVMDMVVMDMVIMDMLAMDMLTLDMVTMDMDMAMDMDIM